MVLDHLLQKGKTLQEAADLLKLPYSSVEATFHRLVLQNAIAFGYEQAVPYLARRYQTTEEQMEQLLGPGNRIVTDRYRLIQPWQVLQCDSWFMLAAGLFLGVSTMAYGLAFQTPRPAWL